MSASPLLNKTRGLFKTKPKFSPATKQQKTAKNTAENPQKVKRYINFFEQKNKVTDTVTIIQPGPCKTKLKCQVPSQMICAPPTLQREAAKGAPQMSGHQQNIAAVTCQPSQPIGVLKLGHVTVKGQPGPTREKSQQRGLNTQ